MAALHVRDLGDYIRDQRVIAQISLRQLARQAGVSNPYLSQIERGLRKPSAEILQQIAKALRISAEALYVQAGILDEREGQGTVPAAVLGDTSVTERQKQVLLEIYESFRKENEAKALADAAVALAAAEGVDVEVLEPTGPAADPEPTAAPGSDKTPPAKAAPATRPRKPRAPRVRTPDVAPPETQPGAAAD